MPHLLAKSTLKINFAKRINTDCEEFKYILYFYGSNTDKVLIELPQQGRVIPTSVYNLQKYIRLQNAKVPWMKSLDGNFMRITDSNVQQLIKIHEGPQWYNLRLDLTKLMGKRDIRRIRKINQSNFRIEVVNNTRIRIHAKLPIWDIWAKISADKEAACNPQNRENDHASLYSLHRLYMKHKKQWFRFPYGNVNTNDGTCMGNNGIATFRNPKQIFVNWISTIFNMDYVFNTKSPWVKEKVDNKGVYAPTYDAIRPYHKDESQAIAITPTLDLTQISLMLQNRRSLEKIGIIDILYYLANIVEIDDFDLSTVFIKMLKSPLEAK